MTEEKFYRMVGAFVRAKRKAQGVKQTELATQIGIKQQNLCHVEKHGEKISLYTFMRALKALDIRKLDLSELDV